MTYSKKWTSTQKLTRIALMSALVFVFSYISIPIGGTARIHFGNIMCLLSGLLFGPFIGGFSAGFGSMIFDLTNPLYMPEFWITFLTKFVMGFMAGFIYKHSFRMKKNGLRFTLSGIVGAFSYIALYLPKTLIMGRFVKGLMGNALWAQFFLDATSSVINGIIAVVGSVILALALHPTLAKQGFLPPSIIHPPTSS